MSDNDKKEELPLIDDGDEVKEVAPKNMSEEPKQSKLKVVLNLIKSIVLGIIIGLIVMFGLKAIGFSSVRVDGTSMYPTYKDGEFQVFRKSAPKDGEIIVFHPSKYWDNSTSKLYIKRLVAKPGDKLVVKDNKVTVNGKLFRTLSEDYAASIPNLELTIPKDKYFVMGDNYTGSNDSLYNYKRMMKYYLVNKSQILFTAKGRDMK